MKKIIMICLIITGITQGAEKRLMPAYAQNKEPIQADIGLALLGAAVAAVALAPASLFVSAAAKLKQTIGGLFDSTSSDSTPSTDTLTAIPTDIPVTAEASVLESIDMTPTAVTPEGPAKQSAIHIFFDLDLKRHRSERKLRGGPRTIIPYIPHPGNGRGHGNEQFFGFDPNEFYQGYENNRN